MTKKSRSPAWVAGAALAVALSFGPATAKASARGGRTRVAFSGRFAGPHARPFVRGGNFRSFARRPFFARTHRPFFQPFRSVRVFVYDPFPHWVVRRVYDDPYCYPY